MTAIRAAACAAIVSFLPAVTLAQPAPAAPPPPDSAQPAPPPPPADRPRPPGAHRMEPGQMSPDQMISQWPQSSQKAYKEISGKYGRPDGVTPTRMVWTDKGPNKEFKEIILLNQEFDHQFPTPHKDCLEHVVEFKVPADKVADLAKFDGSVIVDRTRGTLGLRCDSEAHNLIALNLAYDIINGKKSVDEARKAYGDAVKDEQQGKTDEVAQKLMFQPMQNSGDTDVATIGPKPGEPQPAADKQTPDKQ